MEEVLRLHIIYGKLPSWEILCRNFIVIVCFILLGIGAEYGSENYRNMEKETEYTGRDAYMGMMPEKALDVPSVLDEKDAAVSPVGKINFPERPIPIKEAERAVPEEPGRTGEKRIVPETGKVTGPVPAGSITAESTIAENTAAGNAMAKEKPIVSKTEVGDKIKDISIADGAADDAGNTDKSIDDAGSGDRGPEDSLPVTTIPVTAYGNGGMPEVTELSCERDAFTADMLALPKRLGKLFDGWYTDAGCSLPFTGVEEGAESLVLYAGWKEFPGFLANDSGHIIGCTDAGLAAMDGFLCIPGYEECTGVERGAFDSIRDYVFEVYIPANVAYIENGAFDSLSNLMYIEAASGNPSYYSKSGVLYNRDGTVAAYPAGRGDR